MKSAFHCLHRVQVSHADVVALRQQCERTQDPCHVPGELLRRFTLRGVPAARVDVLLPEEYRAGWGLVLEVGRKEGRFDGRARDRLTVRHWGRAMKDQSQPILPARLLIDRREGHSVPPDMTLDAIDTGVAEDAAQDADDTINIAVLWAGGFWSQTWGCLRSDLADYDLAAVVMWHHAKYYSFLPYDDARLLADSFEASHPSVRTGTLAEANRMASRDLYRLARDLGWRKLTLRERRKYGFGPDNGQWMRVERVDRRRLELGYPTRSGAGQYTIEAGNGLAMRQAERDGYLRTSHGRIEVE